MFLWRDLSKKLCSSIKHYGETKTYRKYSMTLLIKLLTFLGMIMLIWENWSELQKRMGWSDWFWEFLRKLKMSKTLVVQIMCHFPKLLKWSISVAASNRDSHRMKVWRALKMLFSSSWKPCTKQCKMKYTKNLTLKWGGWF